MNKLRSSLAAFALVVIMSGSALLGVGAGSIASAASNRHASSVSASFAAGKSTRSGVIVRPLCGAGGGYDCR
jgi:hypothetical protein